LISRPSSTVAEVNKENGNGEADKGVDEKELHDRTAEEQCKANTLELICLCSAAESKAK
jgi:hypothetical protein